MKNGGWLDSYDDELQLGGYVYPTNYVPQAENGIEGTMGGLTDQGFDYNGAWGGPSMQFGGNLAGVGGSMYARVGAPSKGPRRNQTDVTDASAQNGMEMKYYQEGLDWKPRNISRDGAWLDKYEDAPKAQDGTYVKKPRTDMLTMSEAKKQEQENRFLNAIENQPVIQSPKGKQLTKEQILAKNKQTAEAQGKRFNPETGAVTPFLSPSTARTFERASENIVEPMIDIEMAMSAAPLVGRGLTTAGKFLTEKTALKNVYENIYKSNSLNVLKQNISAQKHRMNRFLNRDIRKSLMESADAGNAWSQEWFSHPATIKKYDDFVIPSVPYSKLERVTDKLGSKSMPSGNAARESLETLQKTGRFTEPKQTVIGNPFDLFDKKANWTQGYYSPFENKAYVDLYNPYSDVKDIGNTVVHENAHAVTGGTKGITEKFNKKFKYAFLRGKNDYESYLVEPTESYARINEVRRHFGLKPDTKLSTKAIDKIIEQGKLGNTPVDTRWFDLVENKSKLKWLFNNAPVVTGAIAAPLVVEEFKKGGEIKKDDMGYWNPENWGEPVEIGSNEITMQGVYEPLLGISNTGDTQMMYPGEDYTFDGESVIEYPVMQKGGRVPIYTDNPRDPRLRAYQDSLSLYKQNFNQLKSEKKSNYEPIEFIKKIPFASIKDNEYAEGMFEKNDAYDTRSKGKVYPEKIKPIYFDINRIGANTQHSAYYKKPVQPVVYKKPEPPTVYVDDLNDPKLRAYQDSLSLSSRPRQNPNPMISIQEWEKSRSSSAKNFKDKGIMPIGIREFSEQPYRKSEAVFAKPKQKVEYRKPQTKVEPKKPEPKPQRETKKDPVVPISKMETPTALNKTVPNLPYRVDYSGNSQYFASDKEGEEFMRQLNKDFMENKISSPGSVSGYYETKKKKNGGWLDAYEN
jgi:hypothetical protein